MDNLVEMTTNKWFEETVSMMNSRDTSDTPVDKLLSGIIPLSHNYCNAVFLLVNSNHRLPAMALIRILSELALRNIWCMYTDNPNKESADERIMRWLKTTSVEEVRTLKKVLPLASPADAQKIQRTIQSLQSEVDNNQYAEVGPFYNSLGELPPLYKEQIYPLLYGAFNRAIHPNLKLLGDLIKQDDHKRTFLGDLEISAQSLNIFCMTAAFNILAIVRIHYEWDYKGMKSEYLSIKKTLASQNN